MQVIIYVTLHSKVSENAYLNKLYEYGDALNLELDWLWSFSC